MVKVRGQDSEASLTNVTDFYTQLSNRGFSVINSIVDRDSYFVSADLRHRSVNLRRRVPPNAPVEARAELSGSACSSITRAR
jgi:hypothetical protein